MTSNTVVVVYGAPAGRRRSRRIGTGTLPISRLVLVDPPLDSQLASNRPPKVRRVGIGAIVDGRPLVEVIEVLQVMESVETNGDTMWALELKDASQAPLDFGGGSDPAPSRSPVLSDPDALADLLRRRRPRLPPLGGHLPPGATPADPTPPADPPPPDPPQIIPAGLWCRLFPRATFCH